MAETGSVLVVDDDPDVQKLVTVNLEARGYQVKAVARGTEALSLLKQEPFDLVILDLVMPGISGIEVCSRIREDSDVPVIVLSAYDEEELKVQALDAGADDYVTKPFGQDELLARIRAVMRRASGAVTQADSKVTLDGLVIDLAARRVFVDGADMRLTRTEFAILAELAQNLEAILTHDELLTRVWGPEYRGSSHYLHVYVGRIRTKMGPARISLLETIPGIGYILHAPRSSRAV